jgi:putative transferase (TIGR04331 family)
MNNKFLVTTADERSWAKDKSILFLGEWCKRFSKKNKWENINSITMPYHWSDYSKFNQDHKYLDTLYEKVLRSVVKCLNDLHDINGSVRYWRTIIGPWLYYFVQIFYDRWKMITNTISEYNVAETIIFELDPKDMIANDMSDFNDARYGSDIWNHWIYGEIIKQHSSVDITYLKILNKTILNKKKVSSYSTKDYSLKLLKYFINKLASSFKKIDYFFINFPKIQQWNLEISLKQFPTSWYSPSIKNYKLDMHKRNNIKLEMRTDNKFETLLLDIIPKQIPTSYLEGYLPILNLTRKIDWPKNPKVILTYSSHNKDDFFKIWAAEKSRDGSKLVINQHGGHFGAGKINSHEDHEIKISDQYFTWGWNSKKYSITKSMPSLNLITKSKNLTPNPKGKMLLVLSSCPRYSTWMYSSFFSSHFTSYVDDQIKFISSLSEEIQKQVKIRYYIKNHGWDEKAQINQKLNIKEEESPKNKLNIKKSINQSRLYVATYNATTFLEVLAANFPTIIFWNPVSWELRDEAKQDFDKLHEVGILHYTPQSAAKKIEIIWNDIESWWFDPELQRIKNQFCEKYARTSSSWLPQWKKELTMISKDKDKFL